MLIDRKMEPSITLSLADLAFGGRCQQPAHALHMRDGEGQSLRHSLPFPFACPTLPSLTLSPSVKMKRGPTPPWFPTI